MENCCHAALLEVMSCIQLHYRNVFELQYHYCEPQLPAPFIVRYSWLAAIERWLSQVECSVINSSQDSLSVTQAIITSYDLLARRAKEFYKINFGVVIMVC